MRQLRAGAAAGLLAVAGAWLVTEAVAAPPRVGKVRAFVGARLFDGTSKAPVDDATILVEAGRVVAAGPSVVPPPGAERVDLRGKFVMPGIVNSHGHVGE